MAPAGIVRPDEIRRKNLSTMVHELRTSERSRAQLAADTGVTKSTASVLVRELEDRGLIELDEPSKDGHIGRPGMRVRLVPKRIVGMGVEVNVAYVSVGFVDLKGEYFGVRRRPLDTTYTPVPDVVRALADLITEAVDEFRRKYPYGLISGITVGVPGMVDPETGTVVRSPNIGWHNVRLLEMIRKVLPSERFVFALDNDANLGAVAEYRHGNFPADVKELLYVTGEAGIGGGIITDGRVLHGARGHAGEFGHMRIDPQATEVCECGRRGCWETQCSVAALMHAAADPGDVVHDPTRDLEERLEVINERIAQGDARTQQALAGVVSSLARGCGVLTNVLDPQVLVLGGYFAILADNVRRPFEEEIKENVFSAAADDLPPIVMSKLGFAAAAVGGGHLALDPVLFDPHLVPTVSEPLSGVSSPAMGRTGLVLS